MNDMSQAVRSLLPNFVVWHQEAFEDYLATFDQNRRIVFGSTVRALFMHRLVIHKMQTDPAVSGQFRPAEVQGLDFLYWDGETSDLAVLFYKGTNFQGRWRTSKNGTDQQNDRRNQGLLFETHPVGTIVCFYDVGETLENIATLKGVYIGSEGAGGFDWVHQIWSPDHGFADTRKDVQLDLFPGAATVSVRRDRKQKAKEDRA